jgi:hypothetical protein
MRLTVALTLALLAGCQSEKPAEPSPAQDTDPQPSGQDTDPPGDDTDTPPGDTDPPGDDTAAPPIDSEDTEAPPVVITGESAVSGNAFNQFSAVVTVTVDQDADVVVEYGEGELTHSTPAARATAGEPLEVLVMGLRASRDYQLQARATLGESEWRGELLSYSSEELPVGWPTCTPTFTADESEFDPDEVVCTQGVTYAGQYMYYCTDYWGEPVFTMSSPGNDSLMSMRPLRDGSWASTSYTSSNVLFFDRFGEQTAGYAASYFGGDTRFEHDYIDSHELYQINSGAWDGAVAFLTNAYEWFDDGSFKLGNGLIVFDPVKREVLYDYSFHGELGDQIPMSEKMPYTRDGNGDYAQDWNHANTILHNADEDGREYFLISLKSQDWVFKLYPDTDELAWALGYDGDFTLVEDPTASALVERDPLEWHYHQHGLVFVEGDDDRLHLLMLDNGYPRHDGFRYRWDLYYSRIVQVALDEESMLAELEFEYGSSDYSDPSWFFSSTCGNSELLADGQRVMTLDGEDATMIEASYPEGEERWRMSCVTLEWCEYRVQWHPNLYETDWIYR